MSREEKAYKEIFHVLRKYEDLITLDIDRLEKRAKCHLFGLELVNKYGFNLDARHIESVTHNNISDKIDIILWDEKCQTISWPDDGKQPQNGLLMIIKYSEGPYFFGQDYPEKLFQKFFLELKSYHPKHVDTTNSVLYFSMDHGARMFNDYSIILKRYRDQYKIESNERKIEKIKKELIELESKEEA